MADTRTGRCLCGKVTFSATEVPAKLGICHCEMCRRWTGSALVGVMVPEASVEWSGRGHMAEFRSSNWAMRSFCSGCGSNLFFRFTGEGQWTDQIEIPVGLFNDPNGFATRSEIWIDAKPDSYAFAGDHKRLTRAEVIEHLPIPDGEGNNG